MSATSATAPMTSTSFEHSINFVSSMLAICSCDDDLVIDLVDVSFASNEQSVLEHFSNAGFSLPNSAGSIITLTSLLIN